MMKQQTLTGFERYAKTTRRAQFLTDMQVIVRWAELTAVVASFYPKVSEAGGRPPLPLERMLRVYFLQLWFNLAAFFMPNQLHKLRTVARNAYFRLRLSRLRCCDV